MVRNTHIKRPKRVLHGSLSRVPNQWGQITNVTPEALDPGQLDFTGLRSALKSWSGSCTRFRIKGHASWPAFTSQPDAWVRASGTIGWGPPGSMVPSASPFSNDYDGGDVVGGGSVASITASGADFETFVYKIIANNTTYWFPADTSAATISFTALGLPAGTANVAHHDDQRVEPVIAPNPSRRGTEISFRYPSSGIAEFVLSDLQGRKVLSIRSQGEANVGGRVRFSRDSEGRVLRPGVYFLAYEMDRMRGVKRVVVIGGE